MRWTIIMISLALAGCSDGGGMADEEESGPPGPERILYHDIEANEIYGASCAFAPSGGGIGAIAIAMGDAGYLKIGGDLLKLAPMTEDQNLGPPEINFAGDEYSFGLTLDALSERAHGSGGKEYDGWLKVNARDGSTVYEADGLIQCVA